jgi:hypothetical protein
MGTSSQKLAVAKAVNYAVAAEVAFVLELHSQAASTKPADCFGESMRVPWHGAGFETAARELPTSGKE